MKTMVCRTRRATQYGVVPPYKKHNAVLRSIVFNPEGRPASDACPHYNTQRGDYPVSIATRCPASLAGLRNLLATVDRP